jgi:hypothetical protein
MTRRIVLSCGVVTLTCSVALATIFGAVRGIIHDPQHRPVQGATVMLKSKSSEWTKNASRDANGEFAISAMPLGDYSITVANPGFAEAVENVVVISGSEPVVHFQLSLAGAKETSLSAIGKPDFCIAQARLPTTEVFCDPTRGVKLNSRRLGIVNLPKRLGAKNICNGGRRCDGTDCVKGAQNASSNLTIAANNLQSRDLVFIATIRSLV